MSSELRWSQLLGEAEQAFRDGNRQRALQLAGEVQDEARDERNNHSVSSAERRSCTLMMATVNVALQRYAR